jgi:hypothetical protein
VQFVRRSCQLRVEAVLGKGGSVRVFGWPCIIYTQFFARLPVTTSNSLFKRAC